MTDQPTSEGNKLGPDDWRFVCVACRHQLIVTAEAFADANRAVGQLGWRVLARCDRDPVAKGGLVCPKCATAAHQDEPEPVAA
jgi:hypothetical protein